MLPTVPKPRPSAESLTDFVLRVQMALYLRNYNPGPIDGVLGPQTRSALEAFQRNSGLSVTGRMDTATLDALGIVIPQR